MTTRTATGGDAASASQSWTLLKNPGREDLDEIARRLDLHPLVIEDLLAGRQQPKAETFGDVLYLSIWDIDRRGDEDTMTDTDLALILTAEELVLVQRGHGAELRDLDALLHDRSAPLAADSPASALHRVLDAVVQDFVDLGAAVEEDLDDLESEVFDSRVHEDYRKIYRLRQRIGQIDRASSGLAEALRTAADHLALLTAQQPQLRPYFTHLENDARGVSELTSAQHASLDALVSSHQSNVAARQNQDMRTISAFAALLAVPTVIAGIYGMNFKNIPLVRWEYGWLAVGIGMIAFDVIAFVMFRRRGWLGEGASAEE